MAAVTHAPASAGTVPALTTPQILNRAFWGIWIVNAAFLAAVLVSVHVHRTGIQMIGKDTVSGMIAAQHVAAALTDIDASVAREFLSSPDKSTNVLQIYEVRRRETLKAIIEAARNSHTDLTENEPTLSLQLRLGNYEAQVLQAINMHQEHNSSWMATYSAAADLLDREVLPVAKELGSINLKTMGRGFDKERTHSTGSRGLVIVAALAVLFALGSTQLFITSRTRRLINIPLLLATCITAGTTFYTWFVLSQVQNDLQYAKEDAFVELQTLWKVQLATSAVTRDEIRSLLDETLSAKYEQDFMRERNTTVQLLDGEPSELAEHEANWAMDSLTAYQQEGVHHRVAFEDRQVNSTLRAAFEEYVRADQRIWTLEHSGSRKEAVALYTATAAEGSQFTFRRFNDALTKAIVEAQSAFDGAVTEGDRMLNGFETKILACFAMIGILTSWGLMQRIREYR